MEDASNRTPINKMRKGQPNVNPQLTHEQETHLNTPDRVPFEDTIVFDMLLDLVSENFEPHAKIIEDEPGLPLEILHLLEKANQQAIESAERMSGKRRLLKQERLDGKQKKKN